MNYGKYALRYYELGWNILPVKFRDKEKKPLISWKRYQTERQTEDEVRLFSGEWPRDPTYKEVSTWFANWKKAPTIAEIKKMFSEPHNLAIVTGWISKSLVVDCDSPAAIELYVKLGGDPNGPFNVTQRGQQFLCGWKKGADLPPDQWPSNFQGREDLPEIDLRGQGGYSMVMPSVHWSGHKYRWENMTSETARNLPEIPEAILKSEDKKGRSQTGSSGEKKSWAEIYKGTKEGSRNNDLTRLVGKWAKDGVTAEDALNLATHTNNMSDPPMPMTDVSTIIQSIYGKQAKKVEAKQDKKAAQDYVDTSGVFFPLTDAGNAERLVSAHGVDMRYVTERKCWYIWDKRCWAPANLREVDRWSLQAARDIPAEAMNMSADIKEAVSAWAKKSESQKNLNSMMGLAQSITPMPISIKSFDRNHFLFNTLNGVIDIKNKGAFREHRREDLITRIAPVDFDPLAQCLMWEKFIGEVFDWNQPIIDYLQRVIGYCLTGSTSEQCMWILYGDGANGKSTFCNILQWLLGDYARTAPRNVFLAKTGGDSHPAELAHLSGGRLAFAEESEETSKFSEGLVKQATGSKSMSVRFMHENFWEMQMTFKIFFQTNHRPDIRGAEKGIWRRIKPIFFPKSFAVTPANRDLDERIFKAEAAGILNWAIAGAIAWMDGGLREPEEVREELVSYMQEMDMMSDFIQDCCAVRSDEECQAVELYKCYSRWAEVHGTWKYSHKRFFIHLRNKLKEKGKIVESITRDENRFYKGITLREKIVSM